jgi:hypothetical protein
MIITDSMLNSSLIDLITLMHSVAEFQSYCLQDLYNTGCRYNELYEPARISEYDINTYKIITEKRSNPRYVLKRDMTDFFNSLWTPTFTSFAYCRESTLQRIVRGYLVYKNIKVGSKGCSSHLFRYNFIKQKYIGGMSIHDISVLIGEADETNTTNYVNGIINST